MRIDRLTIFDHLWAIAGFCGRLRAPGTRPAAMAAGVHDTAARRARAKTGFHVSERLDRLRLGRRTWHWHRRTARPA